MAMSDAQFTPFMEFVDNITNSIQRLVNHVANTRAVDVDISIVPDSVSYYQKCPSLISNIG